MDKDCRTSVIIDRYNIYNSKNKLKDIVAGSMEDSPDLLYKFYMIGEYYRLNEDDEYAAAITDIMNFNLKMVDAIQTSKAKVNEYNMDEAYSLTAVEVFEMVA